MEPLTKESFYGKLPFISGPVPPLAIDKEQVENFENNTKTIIDVAGYLMSSSFVILLFQSVGMNYI